MKTETPKFTITVTAGPPPPPGELARLWTDLESRSDGSFFTSWGWIGAWLTTFGEDGQWPDLTMLTARYGGLIVGLGFLGRRADVSLFGRRNTLALNQSGCPEDDALYIEYNDFLVDRRFADHARTALIEFIVQERESWRAVVFSGAVPQLRGAVARSRVPHLVLADRVCPWVDFTKLAPGFSGYLAALSRNTRQQIQRSLRLYEAEGPVSLSLARSPEEVAMFLSELSVLHRSSWRERKGHEGAFASPRFVRFVKALAANGAMNGTVQLVRVSVGASAIGYLLNFVSRDDVYAYQSGFSYRDDNRFRPGLVTHALAAAHAREQGARAYHFMAGEGRYKSSLANAEEHLHWITLRSDDLRSRAEDLARRIRNRLRASWFNHRAEAARIAS